MKIIEKSIENYERVGFLQFAPTGTWAIRFFVLLGGGPELGPYHTLDDAVTAANNERAYFRLSRHMPDYT